jgi:hypothetical protein
MVNKRDDTKSTKISRRQVLAATAGVSTIGLAGCVDTVLGRVGQSAAENAVSNRHAFPAAFFGGNSRPDRTLIEADYTYQEFEIVVSGEYRGIESSIGLYGDYINSLVKAENHNASRADRMEEIRESDSNGENQKRAQALYDYLDGEATVCERFVVTFPDARLRDSDKALANQVTPPRLLRSTTGETIGRAPQDDDGNVFRWESSVPRLSARISHPWPPLGTTGPFNPNETLLVAGGDGGTDSPTVNVGPLLDPARNDNEYDGVSIANGAVTGFTWDERESWGEETRVGAARVTPLLVASVSAQPEGCPEPIPALLFVQRIRHEDQCLYVGGWTIDDNALYQDSVTILAADAASEVVLLSLEEPNEKDDEEVRRAVLSGLDTERCDERCRLGSVTYDGELGEDGNLNEAVEQFLPTAYRDGRKRRLLVNDIWESAGGRDNRTSVQGMVVPLNPPIVHIDYPASATCRPCETWYCWFPCPRTNLIPAVNNISSR